MTQTESVLIDIKINQAEALKRASEIKVALEKEREALEDLKKSGDKTSEAFVKQEAAVKNLNAQYNANQRVLVAAKSSADGVTGAYSALVQKSNEAAILAKDMAAAYGSSNQKVKEAQAVALKYADDLKAIDKAIGQNQREVGNYELATKRLPGVFGDIQSKGTEAFGILKGKFSEVKDVTTVLADSLVKAKEAKVAAGVAAKAAAEAEAAYTIATKAGVEASALAKAAELARAEATATATLATEASTGAMKVFKYALASTGIGIALVGLGALAAYFTQTNEGAKQFKIISAGVGIYLQDFLKLAGEIGKVLFDSFSKGTGVIDALKGALSLVFTPLRTLLIVFNDLSNRNFVDAIKHIGTGFADMGRGVIQTTKGVVGAVGQTAEAVGGISESVAKASKKINLTRAEEAAFLERQNQKLIKKEQTWSRDRLKLQGEANELIKKSGEEANYSNEQKVASAKKAQDLMKILYLNDIKLLQNKLRVEQALQGNKSKQDKQAIIDLQKEIQTRTNEYTTQNVEIETIQSKAQKKLQGIGSAGGGSVESAADKNKRLADVETKGIDERFSFAEKAEELRLVKSKMTDEKMYQSKLSSIERETKMELDKLEVLHRRKIISQTEYIKKKELINFNAEIKATQADNEFLKAKADSEIAALEYNARMVILKQQEADAALELNAQDYQDRKIKALEDASKKESDILITKLKLDQMTKDEFDKADALRVQELETAKSIANAEFEKKKAEDKKALLAQIAQNEYDTAVLNGQDVVNLEVLQWEAKIAALDQGSLDYASKLSLYNAKIQDLEKNRFVRRLQLASKFAGDLTNLMAKGTAEQKAFGAAQIALDSIVGSIQAYTSTVAALGGGPWGIAAGVAAAAMVTAAGIKATADLMAVPVPNGGGSGGGGGSIAAAPVQSVNGGLVARNSGQQAQQAQTAAVDIALKANPSQPVLLIDNVTDAIDAKAQAKVANSL